MGILPIILLPGLDGTAQLFDRFIAAAPPGLSLTPVALPPEKLTYAELADIVGAGLPDGPIVVIAESFSGPLAVALAARRVISAFVFCNSFVAAPRARVLRLLALAMLFKVTPPAFILRRYMLGPDADDGLVRQLAKVVGSVPPGVLASRIDTVLKLDDAAAFARTTAPALHLRSTDDRLVPESAWQKMAALRPATTSRVRGPHLLLQANPGGAWEVISPFLDGLPTDPNTAAG